MDSLTEAQQRYRRQHGLIKMLRWFWTEHPMKMVLSASLFLFSGILESVSLVLLLPAISTLMALEAEQQNWITGHVLSAMQSLGLPVTLGWILSVTVVVIVLKFGLRLMAGLIVGSFSAKITQTVRQNLFLALMNARWRLFLKVRTSDLVQAMSNDAGKTTKASLAISQAVSQTIQTAAIVAIAFMVDWKFSTAALVLGLITTVFLGFFVRVANRAATAGLKNTMRLTGTLTDSIIVMKALKAMGREGYIIQPVLRTIRRLRKVQLRTVLSSEVMRLLPEPMAAFSIAIAIVWFVPLWSGMDGLLAICFMFIRLHQNLSNLPSAYRDITTGQPAFWFVVNLIDEANALKEVDAGATEIPPWLQIRFDRVAFGYNGKAVLRNANFTIEKGDFIAILGPSGSGKTTAVDLLIGLHKADEGAILVDNVPVESFAPASWRARIGYVPQECPLFSGSVMSNIALGDETLSEDDVRRALRAANILETVEGLPQGLHTPVTERGLNLSGGQRQKLAIARALVRSPEIIIFDEATSALDLESEKEICREIAHINEQFDNQLTILAISHRPAICDIADKRYKIENGDFQRI